MRFIIICLLMVSVCYGQGKTHKAVYDSSVDTLAEKIIKGAESPMENVYNPSVDSLAIPILSIYDLEKLNVVIMKQFDLTEQSKYNNILKELQRLIAEAKKRKK